MGEPSRAASEEAGKKPDLATWFFADGRQETARARGDLRVRVEGGHQKARKLGTELAGWRMTWRVDPREMAEAEEEELKALDALIAAL